MLVMMLLAELQVEHLAMLPGARSGRNRRMIVTRRIGNRVLCYYLYCFSNHSTEVFFFFEAVGSLMGFVVGAPVASQALVIV